MLGEACSQIELSPTSPRHGRARRVGGRTGAVREGQVTDPSQARIDRHRRRAGTTQLHAVVLGRVVARREHRARCIEHPGRVVETVGRHEADVDHIDTLLLHAGCECVDEDR